MVETRAQRKRRANRLASFLCPNAEHSLPNVPEDCPFGHTANNLRPLPTNICLSQITKGFCVHGSVVRCDGGFHPSLGDLDNLDLFIHRVTTFPSAQPLLPVSANSELNLVTCSMAQLQLDSTATDGPINRLPNELLKLIMARLTMEDLISIVSLVCKRWQAVVYSIGRTKQSLAFGFTFGDEEDYAKRVMKRTFGQINCVNYTLVWWNASVRSQLFHCFSDIVSLVFDLHFGTIHRLLSILPVHQLSTLSISNFICDINQVEKEPFEALLALLNRFSSLKCLDLHIQTEENPRISIRPLAPTLARLEQFGCGVGCLPDLIPLFGPNCTRVSLGADLFYDYFPVKDESFYRWHRINHDWLSNLTHLSLNRVDSMDRVIVYLSAHALSLQVLCLVGYHSAPMAPLMIDYLARFKSLAQLELTYIDVDLPALDSARRNLRLFPLVSLRSLTLVLCDFVYFSDPVKKEQANSSLLLASVLSTIAPNLEHIDLSFEPATYLIGHFIPFLAIVGGIKSHWNLFTKLLSHHLEYSEDDNL